MNDSRVAQLTPKEREVLLLVTYDRTTEVIAHMLGLSPNTIQHHIKSARRKLGGVDRFQAAAMLREAEGHQPLVSQPMVMARLSDSAASTPRLDDVADIFVPATASTEAHDDKSTLITIPHALGVLLKIVGVAVALALLAILVPLLSESAKVTFEHLFKR